MTNYQSANRGLLFVGTAFCLSTTGLPVGATGFDLPDQDAFPIGRGMAFVATADNPSAIYYNPAGITQLEGQNLRAGIYGLHLGASYDAPGGGNFENNNPWHGVPQFFYTFRPEKSPVAFGLGLYSPFGLSMEWPQETGFRSVATEGSLTYATLNPVVAWEICPTFSIAGGLTINYGDADLRQGFTPLPGNDEFRFRGDAIALGFNLGLRWEISPQLVFGAAYRYAPTMELEGHTSTYMNLPNSFSVRSDASASFPFPQKIIAGLSYRPTPAWNLEFNVDWNDWDRLNTVNLNQSTPPPGFPAQVPLVLNWQSSMYYEFGATRYFENGWSVSAGYIFNENSVPDANYTPLVADLDRHFLSAGVGHKGQRFSFDLSYQFGFASDRTVSGSAVSIAGQTADGRYGFTSHAVAASVGVHF